MDVLEKEQLNLQEAHSHWYYLSKYAVMRQEILATHPRPGATLADFGCGAGLFLSMIVQDRLFQSKNLVGVDVAYPIEQRFHESGVRVIPAFAPGVQFDFILLMDVLEHIDQAADALQHAASHCRSGGHLFITLPALMPLWSPHDEFLGHRRRYSLKNFRNLAERAGGLEIKKLYYYFACILPVAAPMRWIRRLFRLTGSSDMKRTFAPVNHLLTVLLRWERRWMEQNRLAGLSVIAVCQKT